LKRRLKRLEQQARDATRSRDEWKRKAKAWEQQARVLEQRAEEMASELTRTKACPCGSGEKI